MQKDKYMAKRGRAEIMDTNPIAYTIKDVCFGGFDVLNSANAWWLEKGKVEALIQAYKWDCPDEEAMTNAGISIDQLNYFKEKHPNFYQIKLRCKEIPTLRARGTVINSLDNPDHAFKYLEKKRKKEFGNALDLTTGGEKITALTEIQTATKEILNGENKTISGEQV